MSLLARRARFCGVGEYRDDAEALLEVAGDIAVIERGRLRSILIRCPDGCGDTLVINVDSRAGKAWRFDKSRGSATLYPSVWRADGCESHFILWRDRIVWCGLLADGRDEPRSDPGLAARVEGALDTKQRSALELADRVGELVWDVARALRSLVHEGRAVEGQGDLRGYYRCR